MFAKEAHEEFLINKTALIKRIKNLKSKSAVLHLFNELGVSTHNLPKRYTRNQLDNILVQSRYPDSKLAQLEQNLIKEANTTMQPETIIIEPTLEDEEKQLKAIRRRIAIRKAEQQNGRLTVKQSADYLGVTPERIRGLINTNRLDSVKEPVKEGSKMLNHMIALESLDTYNETKGTKSGAKDHVIRIQPELMPLIVAFCAEHDETNKDVEGAVFFGDIKARLRFQKKVKVTSTDEEE